jgi:hypothetical protein
MHHRAGASKSPLHALFQGGRKLQILIDHDLFTDGFHAGHFIDVSAN